MYCKECQVNWIVDNEPVGCVDIGHAHQLFVVHIHDSRVVLPDGTAVSAVSFDRLDPYVRGREPDYGLYLDHRWEPPWPHEYLEWPDFGVPKSSATVISNLTAVLKRARDGESVEIGCVGGHGRTGTALACAAVLTGCPPTEAVDWVRNNYCPQAIETPTQETFILKLGLLSL
jgi:Protein-tyrosine phosphatase